jgi:hypothetical protein
MFERPGFDARLCHGGRFFEPVLQSIMSLGPCLGQSDRSSKLATYLFIYAFTSWWSDIGTTLPYQKLMDGCSWESEFVMNLDHASSYKGA